MLRALSKLFPLAAVLVLAACTVEPTVNTNVTNTTNNNGSGTNASTVAQQYLESCAGCHGGSKNAFVPESDKTFTSVASLESYISATMPLGGANQCVGSCAEEQANYIWNDLGMGKEWLTSATSLPSATPVVTGTPLVTSTPVVTTTPAPQPDSTAAQYLESCAGCHGGSKNAFVPKSAKTFASVASLESYISTTMPFGGANQCVGNCAEAQANYIWNDLGMGIVWAPAVTPVVTSVVTPTQAPTTTPSTAITPTVTTSITPIITATPNTCTGIDAYVGGNSYAAGDRVTTNGQLFECRPGATSGWCSFESYSPAGPYGSDAWDVIGQCSSVTSTPVVTTIVTPTVTSIVTSTVTPTVTVTPTTTPTPTPTGSVNVAQQYEDSCTACHGGAKAEFKASGSWNSTINEQVDNISQLASYISAEMPQGDSASCDDTCAASIANYIWSLPGVADHYLSDLSPTTTGLQRQFRLLSPYEYGNTMRDTFTNVDESVHALNDSDMPAAVVVNNFDNNSAKSSISARHLQVLTGNAERIIESLTATAPLTQCNAAAAEAWEEGRVYCGDTDKTGVKEVVTFEGQLMQCQWYTDATPDIADTYGPWRPLEGESWGQCSDRFLAEYGEKVMRRPLTTDETDLYKTKLLLAAESNNNFDVAANEALRAMLSSPGFLYKAEIGDGTDVYQLTSWEIASQLSYLFWGSRPDAELMELARTDKLRDAAVRKAQAERLLLDPRADTHLGRFANMWLGTNTLPGVNRDTEYYPTFNAAVGQSMADSIATHFAQAVRNGDNLRNILTDKTLYMDGTLSNFLGFGNVSGNAMTKVTVPANLDYGGIVAHPGFMAAYAHNNETAPILRGVYVRQQLLCQQFATPPSDLDTRPLPPEDYTTSRDKYGQMTSLPVCQTCHEDINGVGFGLEKYDAVGLIQSVEAVTGNAVDSQGNFTDLAGMNANTTTIAPFSGGTQMVNLMADQDSTNSCIATQYYRFAHGISETASDAQAINQLADVLRQGGSLRDMLIEITQLDSFIQRR